MNKFLQELSKENYKKILTSLSQVGYVNLIETEWSHVDVIEHMYLTSKFLLISCENRLLPKILKRNEPYLEFVYDLSKIDTVKIREFGWKNPSHHYPTRQINLFDLHMVLCEQLEKILDILGKVKNYSVINVKQTINVNDIGKCDLYEWIYFLNCHIARHLGILEKRKICLK